MLWRVASLISTKAGVQQNSAETYGPQQSDAGFLDVNIELNGLPAT
jgi:hypothetical protein